MIDDSAGANSASALGTAAPLLIIDVDNRDGSNAQDEDWRNVDTSAAPW